MEIYLPIAEMSVHWLVILGMGAAIGFLSGLFGVGGGFLLTPLLIFYGVPASVGGQISFCVLDNPRGADAIRISTETAGNNPWVAEIAASMYVKEGDLPHALEICRHYLKLEYSGPPLEVVPANAGN